MKLRTPFTVVANPLIDLEHIHDFNYKLPKEDEVRWIVHMRECGFEGELFTLF